VNNLEIAYLVFYPLKDALPLGIIVKIHHFCFAAQEEYLRQQSKDEAAETESQEDSSVASSSGDEESLRAESESEQTTFDRRLILSKSEVLPVKMEEKELEADFNNTCLTEAKGKESLNVRS